MIKIEFPITKYAAVACVLISGMWLSQPTVAESVVFGSGGFEFNMEFVAILDANNPDDTAGNPNPAGSVAYEYSMGKFEVSRDMVEKANAVGSLGLTLADMSLYGGNGADKPATGLCWNEAARFVNWLNTSTGGFAAYKFTTTGVTDSIECWTAADTLDYNPSNPYRSLRANYALVSMDEWYKAAFYDPNTGLYFNFSNGSNTAPAAVTSGTAANTAVYSQAMNNGPANIMSAGGLSPTGIMGLGGNVTELKETAFTLINDSGSNRRVTRGGSWNYSSADLSSFERFDIDPASKSEFVGFRVVSLTVVPEPSSWVLTLIGISGFLCLRRMRK